jgi:hypothetical protein
MIAQLLETFMLRGSEISRRLAGDSVVLSDLFIWRENDVWHTHFELFDLLSLFEDRALTESVIVEIVLFSSNGIELRRKQLNVSPRKRYQIKIKDIVTSTDGPFGTFCVLHSETPGLVRQSHAYLAERGYVGYQKHNTSFISYVHGNYDAIAGVISGSLKKLGSRTLSSNSYHPQYIFEKGESYELFLVNTSRYELVYYAELQSVESRRNETKTIRLKSGGIGVFELSPKEDTVAAIKSKQALARPIIFKHQGESFSVFHG